MTKYYITSRGMVHTDKECPTLKRSHGAMEISRESAQKAAEKHHCKKCWPVDK